MGLTFYYRWTLGKDTWAYYYRCRSRLVFESFIARNGYKEVPKRCLERLLTANEWRELTVNGSIWLRPR